MRLAFSSFIAFSLYFSRVNILLECLSPKYKKENEKKKLLLTHNSCNKKKCWEDNRLGGN